MFHVEHDTEEGLRAVRVVADWAGWPLPAEADEYLEGFVAWLREEAIPAGGLGPREGERVWTRHIADSIAFAAAIDSAPASLLDVGTGVGLPGIPLALLWPDTTITLLDRGGRRTRLLERVIELLEIGDIAVVRRDIVDMSGLYEVVAFRGSLRPADAVVECGRLLAKGGTGIVGVSRRPETPDLTEAMERALSADLHLDLIRVPETVLDGGSWILKIQRRGT
jgi:16S rRNA (guanine527-N7)-methyltransferase